MNMVNHPQPLAAGVVNDFQFVLVNSFVLSPISQGARTLQRGGGGGALLASDISFAIT